MALISSHQLPSACSEDRTHYIDRFDVRQGDACKSYKDDVDSLLRTDRNINLA
jgi:hypothetical protein